MLLGLHTYSFHLHGMGQNWGGHTLTWPRVMDIFKLMDWANDAPDTARKKEYDAVVKSIRYCRDVLHI